MNVRKTIATAIAGCGLALSGAAMGFVDCGTINTIGAWEKAGTCSQGDKDWTWHDDTLNAGAGVAFTNIGGAYTMQITGFDLSANPGAWAVDYTISVTNPLMHIVAAFAGADNPVAPSLLTKNITGDETFTLIDKDGAEGPGSFKLGLDANTLNVAEIFSVGKDGILVSVSDTFIQAARPTPVPGTLALVGLGLVALGAMRRTRRSS